MSAKRLRERQSGTQRSASPLSKRSKTSHVPVKKKGLEDLVNDNTRQGEGLEAKLTNGVSRARASAVDESGAVVAQHSPDSGSEGDSDDVEGVNEERDEARPNATAGQKSRPMPPRKRGEREISRATGKPEAEIIDISSAEESSSELPEDDAEDGDGSQAAKLDKPLVNGHNSHSQNELVPTNIDDGDADMPDAEEKADQAHEPTFGDLLQARHPAPIDVQMSLGDAGFHSRSLVPASGSQTIPVGHSLGTLLSQALRNNDKDSLETCFALGDTQTIRATIQRQRSQEIVVLLDRIAERIHRRPGRAGNLMVWIQLSLVAHGGYLANQPELMKKLKALYQVIRERASGLQPLLHLKGKLDLLSAQLDGRRTLQAETQQVNMDNLDDPSGVIYVEGQEEAFSDTDDEADAAAHNNQSPKRKGSHQRGKDHQSEDEDMNIGMPNGVHEGDEDTSGDEEDNVGNDLVDDEAEEGSEDDEEQSEDEDDEVDGDTSEDESDDDSNANPPAKASNLVRKR
ncbi:Hypothetical predicted protein [Lecanosticta acicola]|uniref:Small-subunit processome Utp12 domain-containing protein n=1 Tax=Lecanosticta acicola TaxID=111012 RepID=A0AAI8Z6V5_9PEZI|nr:Hypothetical predicted protein [Lecanosticta acicola]